MYKLNPLYLYFGFGSGLLNIHWFSFLGSPGGGIKRKTGRSLHRDLVLPTSCFLPPDRFGQAGTFNMFGEGVCCVGFFEFSDVDPPISPGAYSSPFF